ncbi:tRNA(Ile)-lysidine synthetase [hydrothermal vent metagenome]|uniref:tRNA(Ile)-lysidine synthetase n=1 Tax=hydrothermal vent metagenome TaxID=652676 RepID=A0A1W1CS45_9ZZZZ
MLDLDTSRLKNKKSLLAFSAGVDSSALFFLLIEKNIHFDIAIVNYGQREQSQEEVKYAKALARKYKLFCHTISAPAFKTAFEEKAREFRYEFFESLIQIEGYDNLLTAHQLNDQLEWLLMRLSRGAGLSELLGLKSITEKPKYTLLRPLLSHTKASLIEYLESHKHRYFIDKSNEDLKYERNRFRKKFSNALIEEYSEGIKRSFSYLSQDKILLESEFERIYENKSLRIIKLNTVKSKAKACDIELKTLGYLLSASQRDEIGKENSLVIGGKWAIETEENLLYIAPYREAIMPKVFKESCRKAKIPQKIRPYLFEEEIDPFSLF